MIILNSTNLYLNKKDFENIIYYLSEYIKYFIKSHRKVLKWKHSKDCEIDCKCIIQIKKKKRKYKKNYLKNK